MSTPPLTLSPSASPNEAGRLELRSLHLPVHGLIRHQLALGLKGVESTLLVGPRGVGKSFGVRMLLRDFEKQALAADLEGREVRQHRFFETGQSHGSKTALIDVYSQVARVTIGKRSRQDWTPTQFINQIVERAEADRVRLIVIDEAQLINAANIDHLRQLNDIAEQRGSSLRLFLIGNEALARTVAETGQLGERFASVIKFPALSASNVGPHLGGLHPDIPTIQHTLGAKEWAKLEKQMFAAASGSFRRLATIIENGHEMAIRRGKPMTADDIRLAIDKLPALGLL